MPTLVKDIAEAATLVKHDYDDKAVIKLCQRLGVIAEEPPRCPRCQQAMNMAG